jgi:hypothetical protein
VTQTFKYNDLREDAEPQGYFPNEQEDKPGRGDQLLIRSSMPLTSLTSSVKRTMAEGESRHQHQLPDVPRADRERSDARATDGRALGILRVAGSPARDHRTVRRDFVHGGATPQ